MSWVYQHSKIYGRKFLRLLLSSKETMQLGTASLAHTTKNFHEKHCIKPIKQSKEDSKSHAKIPNSNLLPSLNWRHLQNEKIINLFLYCMYIFYLLSMTIKTKIDSFLKRCNDNNNHVYDMTYTTNYIELLYHYTFFSL